MVGPAVKVTAVPAQIVVTLAVIFTAAGAGELIAMAMLPEVAGLPETFKRLEVITQLTA